MSLIEVLEDSIELSLGEREAHFLDDPLEFFETELARLLDICLLADMRESSESEHTLFLEISVESSDDRIRHLTSQREGWVHIRVVPAAHQRKYRTELIVEDSSRVIRVEGVEESLNFFLCEYTSKLIESRLELSEIDDSVLSEVEELASSVDSLTLVLFGESLLSNLLIEDDLQISQTLS